MSSFVRWALPLVAAMASCSRTADPPAAPPAAPEPAIALAIVDEKGLAAALEKARGKVVLVDFWATWCATCVENFPHTLALHRELGPSGLAVFAVSLDEPGDEAQVRAFLARHRASTQNFLGRYGASDEGFTRFDIPAGLPHLRLYDRQGKVLESFPGPEARGIDPAVVERAVRAALQGRSSSPDPPPGAPLP